MAQYISQNPNIYDAPQIQPSDCIEWLGPTATYWMGDCVLRGATYDADNAVWRGGEMFVLIALVGSLATGPNQRCYVGATSDPLYNQLTLLDPNHRGIDFNNDWISTNPPTAAPRPNPTGAQWVNMTLLSPAVRPWNRLRAYGQGDLVYYPDPTVVWRATFSIVPGQPPNVAGLNQVASAEFNVGWALISNPQQYTAFNPNQFSILGTSVNEALPQPLPPTRALPL